MREDGQAVGVSQDRLDAVLVLGVLPIVRRGDGSRDAQKDRERAVHLQQAEARAPSHEQRREPAATAPLGGVEIPLAHSRRRGR